jgi:3',5'-cyclic AMP phosphodiesterase CpdA
MKTIMHLSDLHFGTEEPRLVQTLLRQIGRERPTLVAISGDFTQRARRSEFRKARDFLDQIQSPVLVVPGNHDIPFYDLVRRFLRPLHRYKRYIHADLAPMYQDKDLAVLGLNTARSRTFKSGRLSLYQIGLIRARFRKVHERTLKIIVTHHSFIRPRGDRRSRLIGRHPLALAALKRAGVRLHLAGHFHQGFDDDVRQHHRSYDHSIVVAQAGTALSRRVRGEPNAYNLLRIDGPDLRIQVRVWDGRTFSTRRTTRYRLRDRAWHRLDA